MLCWVQKFRRTAMKKMLVLSLSAAALAGAALPAAAQPYGYDNGYQRYYDRDDGRYERGYDRGYRTPYNLTSGYVDSLYWKLDNAAQEGRLSWREAQRLKAELRPVQEFAHPVETGRASPWQRRQLERVVSRIDAALNQGGYRNAYGYRR